MRLDPREPEALTSAWIGAFEVTAGDHVFADQDGVLFAPTERVEELLRLAEEIQRTERRQAASIEGGETLRRQLRFTDYLERRTADPTFNFRDHLRSIGGAIEE